MICRRASLASICLLLLLAISPEAEAAKKRRKRPRARPRAPAVKPVPAPASPPLAPEAAPVDEAAPEPAPAAAKPAPASPRAPAASPMRTSQPLAPADAGLKRHRYAYVGAGGFLAAGLVFAYSAQGEAKRAETVGNAREATRALDGSRATAATANVLYGLAGVTALYALALEILPEPIAEKAGLSLHF